MKDEQFWNLIERSREGAEECDAQAAKLVDLLAALEADEIIAFDRIWARKYSAAYRWDLWAVAYIINGGCSDDAFMDFRSWLLARGQARYEAALQNPERAADGVEPDEYAECEEIGYAPSTAYERKTGEKMPDDADYPLDADEPAGENWNEDDLPALYPALCERFGW